MGVIFTAKIEGTNDEVIVKEMQFGENQNEKDFILNREVALMSNLSNEYIVKFHGYTVKEGCVRIVLEYLKGGSVENAYQKGELSLKQKVRILLHTAKGLEYLHEKGIIHRDIKPENILLDKEPNDLEFIAKIADFGVSREIAQPTSITGVAGTCAYKAPEHFKDDLCTNKIDIFAFAVYMHEVLSGQKPYSHNKTKNFNQAQLKRKICGKDQLRPDTHVPLDINNEDLVNLCKKNWDADPEKRMTAKEIVENLEKVYGGL